MKSFVGHRGEWKKFVRWSMALCGILFLLACSGAGGLSYAAGLSEGEQRVFDYADLFRDEEKAMLEERAGQLRESMKAEVIILTVEDAEGEESQHLSDRFYFNQGFDQSFGENGILMLIDMDNRECYLGTYGSMIRVMTDQRIQQVLDDVFEYVSSAEYAKGALAGIEGVYQYFQEGIATNQYNFNVETGEIQVYHSIRWYEAVFALTVSAAVAAFACRSVVREYRMEDSGSMGSRLAYQAGCHFRFQDTSDELINTMVTHVVIPRQTASESRGGRSSSGRSSTHSFGGHQAGGGGRKF